MLPHFCRRIEAAMLTSKPCALVSHASTMLAAAGASVQADHHAALTGTVPHRCCQRLTRRSTR
jgi:hypothetical protein